MRKAQVGGYQFSVHIRSLIRLFEIYSVECYCISRFYALGKAQICYCIKVNSNIVYVTFYINTGNAQVILQP